MNLTVELPKQYSKDKITLSKAAVQAAATTLAIGGFIFSYFFNMILNQLLSVVSNLQIIAHMFLITLDYPTNTMNFFGGLFPLVAFDILPLDTIISELNLFNMNDLETHSLSVLFEIVGYETTFTILNLGSLVLVFALTPFITLALVFSRKVPWLCTSVRKKIEGYLKMQFWNGIILFVDSVYLVLVFVSMVGLYDLRLSSDYSLIEKL